MDESYDGSAVPKVFSLSCLVSHVSMWIYFEWGWLKVLEDKNRELRNKGRKELSRFHAKDINNFQGEYEDWTSDERLDFCAKLTEIFKRNPVHIHGWDMPLQILIEEISETPSVITSKAANGYHPKTGQWRCPGLTLFYHQAPLQGAQFRVVIE